MELVAAMLAASAPLQPEAVAAAMLFAAGFAFVRRLCRRPCRRQPLRRCPLCRAEAVGTLECEVMDALEVRVRQQCGQCGVWRQIVTPVRLATRHERTLQADRSEIRRRAERLERDRLLLEADAFVTTLRDEVIGAEDLLALIGADTSARRDENR
jgi:hypothetical protein